MKISQIVENASTTSGSIAPTEHAFVKMQTRNPSVYGDKKVGSLFKGKKTSKPFVNSISEGKQVDEAELSEDDIIMIPGRGNKYKPGFHKIDPDKAEHEGQTLKNSLHTIIRVATHLEKELSVRDSFPEWVSEKVGGIKSEIVTVMNYLISQKEMHRDGDTMEGVGGAMASDELMKMSSNANDRSQQNIGTAGVVAGGAQYEGKKVDRMVQHIKQSEKKLGKSSKEAENIAWATVNKRGMLDNKNKKK